jgi:glycine betaine/proline transport system substrate-binding protein
MVLRSVRRAAAACATIAGVAAACGGTSSGPATGNVIKMAHNDWLAANLNDAVAEQLLTNELGYTVELVPAGTSDQFDSIARGDLHVTLEVWPGGHQDAIARYIDQEKTIEYAGLLGPNAKAGWFVPRYVIDEHPELATWDGFRTPGNVALFAVPMTTPHGQFIGGDPTWVEYDQQIIQNLGLDFQVKYAGSEDAEIAEIESAAQSHLPIVMYFWVPHWAVVKYDMSLVALPPYTPGCWAKAAAGGIDCDYPTDHLFKMVWSGLRDYAPAAYRFFLAMGYPTQTQLDMMALVKEQGMSVDQAASAWVAAHRDVWQPWVDAAKK